MTPKIGIIEDDSALREGLALAFELEGYETAAAGTMTEGRRLLEAGGPVSYTHLDVYKRQSWF